MANEAHLNQKGGTCFGLFAFAWAADSASFPRVRLPAPGPTPRADWPEGARELEITLFYCCYCFTAQPPPPPLPPLAFSPPTVPFPSPRPPLAQLKERGSSAAPSFIWGNSWPLQVYYAKRSQCQARRTRRAKHRGRGAEQYPSRAGRREQGLRGGSYRPSARWRGRPASTLRPSATAAVRWSCGHSGSRCRVRSSLAFSFSPRGSAWPAHGRRARAPWPRNSRDFILRAPFGASWPGVRKACESVCVRARVRAGVGAAALRLPLVIPPLRSAPHTSLLLPPPARPPLPCPPAPATAPLIHFGSPPGFGLFSSSTSSSSS